MNKKIITLGGATEDITIYPQEATVVDNKKDLLRQRLLAFEYGAKISVEAMVSSFGGGSANSAISFSNLGFNSIIITALGKDERAKKIKANLKAKGVDTSYIINSSKNLSPYSLLVIGPKGEHVAFVYKGSKVDLSLNKKSLKAIKTADWLYVTSLSTPWKSMLFEVVTTAKKVAWNPGSEQLKLGAGVLKKYFKKTTVLCLNKDEAIELVFSDKKYKDKNRSFFNDNNNLLKVIKEMGPEIVVITLGKDGSCAYDGDKIYKQKIMKEQKRVDTTGVGDAHNSAFVYGLELYEGDIQKALKLGAKNSASVISAQGAQNGLLRKKDIKNI
ncbi:carbohydrate kinase family protein [Patescibacteria group bacterium]|nr:carbohydrate kinase family protein [Patescibacteria group bacterium]